MISCEEGEAGALCTQAVNMSMHGCCFGDCRTEAKPMAATTCLLLSARWCKSTKLVTPYFAVEGVSDEREGGEGRLCAF